MEIASDFSAPAGLPSSVKEQDFSGGMAKALAHLVNRLSRAMAPAALVQDVRSEQEQQADYEPEW